jgi:polysaccharide export outer membrane protein
LRVAAPGLLRHFIKPLFAIGLFALAGAGLPVCAVSQTEPVVQPGDALRIQVWRMPELSGEFDIDAAGRLLHPLYDSVTVTGIPLPLVRARLAAILNQQQAGLRFTLQPLLRVAVEGEVQQPSADRYTAETTIAQAIASAGGPTERGNMERVRLVRGSAVSVLNLRDPASPMVRAPIQSGDRIILDRRRSVFRDYVMPFISVLGTAASVATLIRRSGG